ncbi:MAG TPA: DUF3089 domain-containing protein [Allosphingosinicella sp.]|nr:DUF3089 domain-containing protein [Allosphingosinicella sp.]
MRKFTLLLLVATIAAAPADPASDGPVGPADYAKGDNWLCLPGRADACASPDTVELGPNGYGAPVVTRAAADPPADCFYLYPTVSRDPGFNSDLSAGMEERMAVAIQFARYSSVCRPFVPVYRSGTVHAVRSVLDGLNPDPIFARAYGDVEAAWRHYLRHYNNGRPVVIIAHSQGSIYAIELLKREFEGRPLERQLVSAIIPGFTVEVPQGRVAGGTFRSLPLCTRAGQTGCVVSYVSFREGQDPPADAMFGHASRPDWTIACTNPAALGSSARVPLDSYFFTGSNESMPSRVVWSSTGRPPTRFVHTSGLANAACVNRGTMGYLSLGVNADPDDARADDIPGEIFFWRYTFDGWGMHLADMNAPQGDLIRMVATQSAAWQRNHDRLAAAAAPQPLSQTR